MVFGSIQYSARKFVRFIVQREGIWDKFQRKADAASTRYGLWCESVIYWACAQANMM